MSDLYIVTVEDAQDGTFFEDPEGFDSVWQAKEYAAKQAIPNGHVVAVYRCDMIESFENASTVSAADSQEAAETSKIATADHQ